MAINLDILKDGKNTDVFKKYTYADVSLDIELNSYLPNNTVGAEKNKQDLKVDYDEAAIYQSVKNIFNTKKGQKILAPDFGLDIEQFLFEQISKENADIIGNTILEELGSYEPRITVERVNVTALPNEHQYTLNISIIIPTLNDTRTNVVGSLTKEGFTY
jgi:phage baseplate assembly protein W